MPVERRRGRTDGRLDKDGAARRDQVFNHSPMSVEKEMREMPGRESTLASFSFSFSLLFPFLFFSFIFLFLFLFVCQPRREYRRLLPSLASHSSCSISVWLSLSRAKVLPLSRSPRAFPLEKGDERRSGLASTIVSASYTPRSKTFDE